MNLRSIFLPACLALFACSSDKTVEGSGGSSSGGVSGGGGSPTGGGSGGSGATGGTAGSAPTGGGGTAGSGGGMGGTGGADCDAGPIPCGVEIVAQGVANPYGLVLRGTEVYFTSASAVLSCPKTGCKGTPTTVAGNQTSPRNLALRSGSPEVLFWTNKASTGAVMRCDLAASCDPKEVMTGLNNPDHLAISASHAFFSDGANTLRRCDNTLNQTCATIFQPTASVGGLVFAQDRLYWSVPSQNRIDACVATNCADPTGQLLFTAGPNVSAMATSSDGSDLFWVHDLDPSPLKRCPTSGCPGGNPILILQNAVVLPRSIATVGSEVFMLQSDGAIVSCGVSTCPSPTKHSGPFGTGGKIAVDGTHMYWTVPDKGYVLRKSKL